VSDREEIVYLPAGSGPMYWGPGDRYTFLVTGQQSGGALFILEALVPPGGGPPPHIHHNEVEAFYLLAGTLTVRVGDQEIEARAGDFLHVPKGAVHGFRNSGQEPARLLAIFSPSGMEHYFEEAVDPAPDREATPPPPSPELIARMIAAAPKHGVEWV
jgi:quercetin dioxygenase-like cupin family protein